MGWRSGSRPSGRRGPRRWGRPGRESRRRSAAERRPRPDPRTSPSRPAWRRTTRRGVNVVRGPFCDRVSPTGIEHALGDVPADSEEWDNGDRERLPDGTRDRVHEYGCRWTAADGTAGQRVGLRAAGHPASQARELVRGSLGERCATAQGDQLRNAVRRDPVRDSRSGDRGHPSGALRRRLAHVHAARPAANRSTSPNAPASGASRSWRRRAASPRPTSSRRTRHPRCPNATWTTRSRLRRVSRQGGRAARTSRAIRGGVVRDVDGQAGLVGAQRLERGELRLEEGRRHEVVAAGHPLEQHPLVADQVDEAGVLPPPRRISR